MIYIVLFVRIPLQTGMYIHKMMHKYTCNNVHEKPDPEDNYYYFFTIKRSKLMDILSLEVKLE